VFVLAWAWPHLPPVTLAASLVRYEYDTIVGKRNFKSNYNPFILSRNYKNFITAYFSAKLMKTNLNFKKRRNFVV